MVVADCPSSVTKADYEYAVDVKVTGTQHAIKKIMLDPVDEWIYMYHDANAQEQWGMLTKMSYDQEVEYSKARVIVARAQAIDLSSEYGSIAWGGDNTGSDTDGPVLIFDTEDGSLT